MSVIDYLKTKVIDLSNVVRELIVYKQEVFRLDHSDWEDEFDRDKSTGNIIMVTDQEIVKDGLKPNNDSIFNSRFNVPVETDDKIVSYSCDCGKLIGRYNENETCQECSTIVIERYSNEILKRGWIDLGVYKIIVPSSYMKLKSFMGGKKLDDIINIGIENNRPDIKNPFKGIGLVEFERRFEEILNYFKVFSTKPQLYDVLLKRRNIIFSSKIPVMSPALRPGFISGKSKTVNVHNINSLFVTILTDLNLVKSGKRIGNKAIEIMYKIQNYIIKDKSGIYDLCAYKIKGKERLIRRHIIAGRMWYSSRMVVVSETSFDDIDTVTISYKGFLGLFELEIVNCMMRGYGNPEFSKMTATEAKIYLEKVKYKNKIDPAIYDIMDKLINNRKDDGVYVLVGRNPSFDIGSLQMFKVGRVDNNAKKKVITIPHNSLGEYSGDYDGDVFNVYSPKERCVIDEFKRGFLPSRLIIDRTGGYYNPKMMPIKDELAFIRCFCDSTYTPTEYDENTLKGIPEVTQSVQDMISINAAAELQSFKVSIGNPTYYNNNITSATIYKGPDVLLLEHYNRIKYHPTQGKICASSNCKNSKFVCDPVDLVNGGVYKPISK